MLPLGLGAGVGNMKQQRAKRMIIDNQMTFSEVNDEYATFVEKFKPKKTTDDCYTPNYIYDAVLGWVVDEYGIDPGNVVRPFWPGCDYLKHDYPEGCTVVDNPPFSIITKICTDYQRAGIKFFLFAPYLTNFSSQIKGLCHVIVDYSIVYENGANIATSYLTNLDDCEVRSAPTLQQRLKEAQKLHDKDKPTLPKYCYPDEVLTVSMVGYMCKNGIDYKVKPTDCFFVRGLESQKAKGKTIFGSGYLLSEKAAAEKAAAEKAAAEKAAAIRWPLSESEKKIIKQLEKRR